MPDATAAVLDDPTAAPAAADEATPESSLPTYQPVPQPPEPQPAAAAATGEAADTSKTEAPTLQAPQAPDWRAALDGVAVDELLRHPRLAGIIGNLLQRERPRIRAEEQAALGAQAEQDRLAGLMDADPEGYVAEVKRQRAAQQNGHAAYGLVNSQVAAFQQTLPPEVQQGLSGKTYAGSYGEGFRAYLDDVVRAAVEHEVQQRLSAERTRWEKDVLPGLKSRALAEVRGGEPTPDLDGGAPPTGRVVTDDDIARMDLAQYDALFDERGEPRPGVVYRRRGQRPA